MRKRQACFLPLPGIPCAGSLPRRASPNRVFRGISRKSAARSALTNGSGLSGEEEIEFDTVDLTDEAFRRYVPVRKKFSDSRIMKVRETEDRNIIRLEAMLFDGWGMQILYALPARQ